MARTLDRQREETRAEDDLLIRRVAAGDRRAFEALYDRYSPAVFGVALKMLGDREAAEEAVQEIFWRIWQRSGSFDSSRAFAPWLFGIAHNYSIDELRRRRVRPQQVYEDDDRPILSEIPDDADVGETAVLSDQRRLVREALDQLPEEQRQALLLAYFGGLTQQEIAAKLGNPLGTVKTRMRLGLQKLRSLLQGQMLVDEE
ncbi:MAG TPA: sigma-70 family RNA polymerase sigma factor [Herpetosiphonaceae bacterium]|nr:sigma-70 family RNA polymerase sigma factor [Herpetosiphonaceae bacterium]